MSVKITVNNIGPLRKAEAELKPLTLLVGPNNSGKSTLATVMYAALAAGSRHVVVGLGHEGFLSTRPRIWKVFGHMRAEWDFSEASSEEGHGVSKAQLGAVLRALAADSKDDERAVTSSSLADLNALVEMALRGYARELVRQVERAFGDGFPSLARSHGKRRMPAKLVVESLKPRWRVEVRPRGLTVSPPPDGELPDWLAGKTPEGRRALRALTGDAPGVELARPLVYGLVQNFLFSGFPNAASYLPAARSGFLQSHRLLASSLVRQAPRAGIEDVGVPRLTGIVSDFVGQLLELSPTQRSGPFDDVTHELENAVLGGRITLPEGPASYPEISYQSGDVSLPLHRTSSMVSELAPVVLYLRYVLRPGDVLVIEEPEAHLHPESQIVLANALARLVSEGLQVVLTTHSDYFLQQVNNTIMASALEPGTTTRDDVLDLPKLSADQVGAYRFRSDAQKGTTTRELPVKPHEGGVSDKDFAEVTEAQYDQTVEIDRRLIDAG